MKTKVYDKSSDLTSILVKHFGKRMNLARIKLIGHMIIALCKVQTVNYGKLCLAFDTYAKASSNLRRIQRFMSEYALNMDLIGQLIHDLLPSQKSYRLAMDRTCWDFGCFEMNLLVLSILHKGHAFPVLFLSCKGRGNSSISERSKLLERFMFLFGKESIESLVADREFIGSKWMNYLYDNQIKFYLRIKGCYMVKSGSGRQIRIDRLFDFLKVNEQYSYSNMFFQKQSKCYLTGFRFLNKDKKPELLVIASAHLDPDSLILYRMRWQIECAFKAFKSSGFNLEDTHLSDKHRIEKLFAIVAVAYTWAYLVGIFIEENIKPIRILRTGRKAYSVVKYGLLYITRFLLTFKNRLLFDPVKFLSCT